MAASPMFPWTCRLVKPPAWWLLPLCLSDSNWAVFHPVRLMDVCSVCQHILLSSAYADLVCSLLMYSSPSYRHLVNPFRTYQLCSSAHKPITSEALCSGTQVPDWCTKPNWVMWASCKGACGFVIQACMGNCTCYVAAATLLNIDLNHSL